MHPGPLPTIILWWGNLWACSQRKESHSESRFGTWFGPFPDFTLCECKALSNQAFEMHFETKKKGVLDRDSRRKPESEHMLTQRSYGTWFVRVHFANARWSHAWVNQHGLRSRNKILPRSAQILFMIRTAFAMLVNAHSSNHDSNHEAAFGTRFTPLWTGQFITNNALPKDRKIVNGSKVLYLEIWL